MKHLNLTTARISMRLFVRAGLLVALLAVAGTSLASDPVLVTLGVTPTNPSVPAGRTQPFTATGVFSDGSTRDLTSSATWSSSDTSATISNATGSKGVATGISPGVTEISALLGSISGSTTLTVTDAVLVAINVTPINPSVPAGLSLAFTATGTFSDGTTRDLTSIATWSSSASSATISNAAGSNGVATGVSPGVTQISAQSGSVSGSTTLTVTSTPSYTARIQPPITADGTSVFKANRGVIPVKFTLTQDGVATCALPAATIAVTRTSGGTTGAIDESVYVMAADNGSNFRIASCQYVYNLSASALGVGTYRADIMINGAVVGNAIFQLK